MALLIEFLRVGVFTAPFTRAGTAERALAPLVIADLPGGGDMETEEGRFGGERGEAVVAIMDGMLAKGGGSKGYSWPAANRLEVDH